MKQVWTTIVVNDWLLLHQVGSWVNHANLQSGATLAATAAAAVYSSQCAAPPGRR